MSRPSAHSTIAALADPSSFDAWHDPADQPETISPRGRDSVQVARDRTGAEESVRAGSVRVGGVPACVLAWEFEFLGGSVGQAAATIVVTAIRRATRLGLPVLALPRSGGTRMQEGAGAFVQMAAITAALAEHRHAGLPYLVHLGDPTTGGVLASLGSLGDRTTAEPDAMVGFLGPRAVRAITGQPLPAGVQVAEHLRDCGIVDEVAGPEQVRRGWVQLLTAWRDRAAPPGGHLPAGRAGGAPPESADQLWAGIEWSRRRDRAGVPELVAEHLGPLVGLGGDAAGGPVSGAVVGVGRLAGGPVVVAAAGDRRTGTPLTVADLRTLRRGIELAGRWGLPLLTLVDTLGAPLDAAAEEAAVAGEVARTMAALVSAPVPTVAGVLGPGTGGAALALLPADRIVATAHSWVAPLAPEGAAAIRPGGSPAEVAWEQGVGAHALARAGIIDVVVDDERADWLTGLAGALAGAMAGASGPGGRARRLGRFAAWAPA